LSEWSPSSTHPARYAVATDAEAVQQQSRVLDQPCRNWVRHWDTPAHAALKARAQSPELATQAPDAYLDKPVALAFVGFRLLFADRLKIFDLDTRSLDGLDHYRLQGSLVVRLEDELLVSDPLDIRHDQVAYVCVFAGALHGDNVREYQLSGAASHDHALCHFSSAACVIKLSVALRRQRVLLVHLVSAEQALVDHVEIIDANDRNATRWMRMSGTSLFPERLPKDAFFAPRPEG
jgi:hypothetical protein